jgi:uncharacterized membrane protein YebE (DUF533 family)
MIDAKQLLDQLFGSGTGSDLRAAGRGVGERLNQNDGTRAFAGGAVTGGLLGLLLGSKKARKMAGGALGYGGAAVIGALAMRAYENYRQQSASAASPAPDAMPALPHMRPAADGSPFELTLVRAMVGAAKADGHMDAAEQRKVFAEVERLDLDAEAKAYVFDLLGEEIDLASLASAVATPEQGAELYLAARLAIDPDEPGERAFLDALASRLRIAPELRAQLETASAEGDANQQG